MNQVNQSKDRTHVTISCLGCFCPKNYTHLKKFQMVCFAINSIISIHTKCDQRSGSLWILSGDNASVNWIIEFRKENTFFFRFILCNFSVWTLQYFFRKLKKNNNCPQKLLIIPLDQQFLIQQVFALCSWDNFCPFFLIFEVVKQERFLKVS